MLVELIRDRISIVKRVVSLIFHGSSRKQKRHLARILGEETLMVSFIAHGGVGEQIVGQVIDINTAGLAFLYIGNKELTSGLRKLDLFVCKDPHIQIKNLPCKMIYDYRRKFILRLPPLRRCGVNFDPLPDTKLLELDRMIRNHIY